MDADLQDGSPSYLDMTPEQAAVLDAEASFARRREAIRQAFESLKEPTNGR